MVFDIVAWKYNNPNNDPKYVGFMAEMPVSPEGLDVDEMEPYMGANFNHPELSELGSLINIYIKKMLDGKFCKERDLALLNLPDDINKPGGIVLENRRYEYGNGLIRQRAIPLQTDEFSELQAIIEKSFPRVWGLPKTPYDSDAIARQVLNDMNSLFRRAIDVMGKHFGSTHKLSDYEKISKMD